MEWFAYSFSLTSWEGMGAVGALVLYVVRALIVSGARLPRPQYEEHLLRNPRALELTWDGWFVDAVRSVDKTWDPLTAWLMRLRIRREMRETRLLIAYAKSELDEHAKTLGKERGRRTTLPATTSEHKPLPLPNNASGKDMD